MKVSVITVSFNSATYIADTLRSIDSQAGVSIEHLVVDGASQDRTLEIVAAHGRTWRRAVSEPDHGIYDAMNKGLRLATGDVIGFINSDDLYSSPHALARIAAAFGDPAVDAVYGDLCYVRRDEPSTVVRYWQSSPFRPGLFREGWCPPHPTLYVRREIYERCGGFDTHYRIAADVELMLRFFEVCRIRTCYLPGVLVHMRLGGTTNRSLGNILAQNREILRALRAHGQRPSICGFAARKLMSRGRQFWVRPA